MTEFKHAEHTIEPVYDEGARILILGSFPSVKSRESQFFYGHPQNRFWKMLAQIKDEKIPETVDEKKAFLLRNHIAVWDVIASCEIKGSSDSSIQNIQVNDITRITKHAPIQRILINGGKAYDFFCKYYCMEDFPTVYKMPSTSPANAAWSLEKLVTYWREKL